MSVLACVEQPANMRDSDTNLSNGSRRAVDDDHEMESLKMELLKTKLELDQTRAEHRQSIEESRKLKKLLQEIQGQKRQLSVTGADKKAAQMTPAVIRPLNNQTHSCRCKELEQEVISLHSVLELRTEELRSLRNQCATAEEKAKQLPAVLKANSALKLQIECLTAQLEKKSSNEQSLMQENKTLLSSIQYESEQNRRLSLCNEELQWKLRKNTTSEYRSSPLLKPAAQSTPTKVQRDANCQPHSLEHSRPRLTPSTKENLQSPQIYGVVEKEDSISWIIDIEQRKEGFASTRPVKRIIKFNKEVLTKSPKSSPDQLKKSTSRLTTLQKKKLLR